MRVYIAGPYTEGDRSENVRNALEAATILLDAGHAPFCPHLSHFWDLIQPRPYNVWMNLDLTWLSVCDAMIRLHGPSKGADVEEAHARSLGIPVLHSVDAFLTYARSIP